MPRWKWSPSRCSIKCPWNALNLRVWTFWKAACQYGLENSQDSWSSHWLIWNGFVSAWPMCGQQISWRSARTSRIVLNLAKTLKVWSYFWSARPRVEPDLKSKDSLISKISKFHKFGFICKLVIQINGWSERRSVNSLLAKQSALEINKEKLGDWPLWRLGGKIQWVFSKLANLIDQSIQLDDSYIICKLFIL